MTEKEKGGSSSRLFFDPDVNYSAFLGMPAILVVAAFAHWWRERRAPSG
jgi:hypothetical protein